MNSLGEYNDDHGMQDVILLIDIEKNFAKNMPTKFKLDPWSFAMFPSLS